MKWIVMLLLASVLLSATGCSLFSKNNEVQKVTGVDAAASTSLEEGKVLIRRIPTGEGSFCDYYDVYKDTKQHWTGVCLEWDAEHFRCIDPVYVEKTAIVMECVRL